MSNEGNSTILYDNNLKYNTFNQLVFNLKVTSIIDQQHNSNMYRKSFVEANPDKVTQNKFTISCAC